MDIRKLQRAIVDGLEDVKGQHIAVFNTEHLSPLFERVIIASGTSNRQTKALAASVRDAVKSGGFGVPRVEGEDNGEWIIVDCGAAVVHVMQPNIREYYHLEEIWGDKPVKMKIDTAPKALVKAAPVDEPLSPAKKAAMKRPAAKKAAAGAAAPKPAAAKKSAASKAPASKAPARKAAAAPARKAAAAPAAVTKTTGTKRAAPVKSVPTKTVAKAPAKSPAAKRPARSDVAPSTRSRSPAAKTTTVKITPRKTTPRKAATGAVTRTTGVKRAPAKKAGRSA
jgi:ribosome-associated protein